MPFLSCTLMVGLCGLLHLRMTLHLVYALQQRCTRAYLWPFALQAPFTYEALPPEKINFIPLKQKKSFNGRELMQVWQSELSHWCDPCKWSNIFACCLSMVTGALINVASLQLYLAEHHKGCLPLYQK